MERYFGEAIDLYGPLKFLMDNGWDDDRGILSTKKQRHEITMKEFDCVDFLCDEWDFGYAGLQVDRL